ncbi:MAG TPA: hypothetical protein PKL04_11425 [Methanofastidiosum sp.]|nr:hypothetical protein [Methanofastidiosum sp.]
MNDLFKIEEPKLLFGYDQKLEDPRDGLTIFGPLEKLRPYGIISGVISTKRGLEKFKVFLKEIEKPLYNRDNVSRPFFPGFNSVFKMEWSDEKIYHINIEETELGRCLYYEDVHDRTYHTVSLFADKIISAKKDEHPDINLWIIIVPDEVYESCRPQSTIRKDLIVTKKTITKSRAKRYLQEPSIWDELNIASTPYAFEANFHNQLKARLLKHTLPTQIIRESTLYPYDYLNSLGTVRRDFSKIRGHMAWSISTAAFYKTGGKPWKLADIRKGVCYVGLVFKKDERSTDPRTACCAAQMFLDSGDGFVFKGAVGPWYNSKFGDFHLKPAQAEELIRMAIDTYKSSEGVEPSEIFLHAKTRFNEIEWQGFVKGAGMNINVVGVTIKDHAPLKIYRDNSKFPILRGLAYINSPSSGYLWTVGFVPRLDTSLASEVPNPLYVEITQGDSDIRQVLQDILSLTKLNYNACIYADGKPVTLRFADNIGDILTAAPLNRNEVPPLSFKYYI